MPKYLKEKDFEVSDDIALRIKCVPFGRAYDETKICILLYAVILFAEMCKHMQSQKQYLFCGFFNGF